MRKPAFLSLKKATMEKRLVLAASIALCMSGCGVLFNLSKGEKAIEDLYFTYIGNDNPFAPSQEYGMVLGALSFDVGPKVMGSIFSVRNVSTGAIVPVTLEFRKARKYGVIKWKKKYSKQTTDIYAGDYTDDRKSSLKEIVGTGTLVGSYFMGNLSTATKNLMNMEMALPQGWFIVKLPVGEYEIVNAEADYFENATSSDITLQTTTTTVTKYSNSLARGPVFRVTPAAITYTGSYLVNEQGALQKTVSMDDARRVLAKAVSRLQVVDPVWQITE